MPIEKLYHGTSCLIKEFDIMQGFDNSCTYNNGGGIYFCNDSYIATQYSIESYIRLHANEFDDDDDECNPELIEKANEQAHYYECNIDTSNALVLSTNIMTVKNKYTGMTYLNIYLLCEITNILQNRYFEKYMDYHDETARYQAMELLSPYLDEYDEENDEYIEKDIDYTCIIVRDIVDSINDESNYPTDVCVVLDESIILDKKLVYTDKELLNVV